MKSIWKYPLTRSVVMPQGAQVISVGEQLGSLYLWAIVENENPPETRNFDIIGTGWDLTHEGVDTSKYFGRISQNGFEWHVFEK